MNSKIKDKIKELFKNTPDDIGVSWGKKVKGGIFTGERCIVFKVKNKKPLKNISKDQILPTEVEIDNTIYKTDVWEVGEIKPLSCDNNTINNCYDWVTIPPTNRNRIRPLMGGIKITSDAIFPSWGTLGLIAIDTETSSLIGITNNHVAVANAFYTTDRNPWSIQNTINGSVYQNTVDVADIIGKVIRYNPIYLIPEYNKVDGAIISITSSTIDISQSFKQHGLSYALPMEFATTEEIDDLLSSDPPIYSSGARSGVKGSTDCGLTISALDVTIVVGPYMNDGAMENVYYEELIEFTRLNPDCAWPINGGDSGSVLIANFSGIWKIIGLCFAGGYFTGYACRIDNVANELNISAWDESAKNFIDLSSQEIITVNGVSADKTITCNGKTYWQIGSGLTNNPCVE